MTDKPAKPAIRKEAQAAAEARQHRSAEALRANLRRRKAQERDRAEDAAGADKPAGRPEKA